MADILARQRQIVGSAGDWATHDLVLGDGEIALVREAGGAVRARVGNGTSPFSASPYLAESGTAALRYRGNADPTAAPPAAPVAGDAYTASPGGVVAASWGAPAAGETVAEGDLLIFDSDGQWNVQGGAIDVSGFVTLDELASHDPGEGAGMVGAQGGGSVQDGLNVLAYYRNVLRYIPPALWAGIADRTITTDLTPYILAAIAATPPGANLYFPARYYPHDGTIAINQSVYITGDPANENHDNSWDYGISGTTIHHRGTTGNGWEVIPPDVDLRRINVTFAHLTFRGSRLTHAGTSGSCMYVNGRNYGATYVRLGLLDVNFNEAPHHGLHITGQVYGGGVAAFQANRNGYCGFIADASVAPVGEMVMGRVRCFQNGNVPGASQVQRSNFVWLGGSLAMLMLSATESQNGPGAILGGGPIVIDFIQAETNHSDDSVIIGQDGNGIRAMAIGGYMIAPGSGYTHAHIRITPHAIGHVSIGPGFHADSLGAGGKHLWREAGAGDLDWKVTPNSFEVAPVIVDTSTAYNSTFPLLVMARGTVALSNATGDGTDVVWAPDAEIADRWNAYNHLTGTFVAPITGLYEFIPQITLTGYSAGHDRSTFAVIASSYGKSYRTGSPIGAGNAAGAWSIGTPVVVPMQQGETAQCQFNVGGGSKTVGTVGDPSYANLIIRNVG